VEKPSISLAEHGTSTGSLASSVTVFLLPRVIDNTVSSSISTVKEERMKQAKEISAIEAARRLGVGLDYLYGLLWTGKLKARKANKKWLVSADSVEARLKTRGE
jgi:excisionase family DNA binding protein